MKRWIRRIVSLLLLLCLAGGVGRRVAFALGENARLEEGFTPKAGIPPYDEKDPEKSWDYSGAVQQLAKRPNNLWLPSRAMEWNDPMNAFYLSDSFSDQEIARRDAFTQITWYAQPSTSSEIMFRSRGGYYLRSPVTDEYSAEIVLREGRNSWPTHKKGWRYSIPFWVPEKNNSGTRTLAPSHYVQLRDLEIVEQALMEKFDMEYVPYRERVLDLIRGGEPPAEVVEEDTGDIYGPPIYIDKMLYENGIFISPDLYLDVWTLPDTLMVIGALLLVAINIIVEVRVKKHP